MTPADMQRALRELEVIDQRCGHVVTAIMRSNPDRIEGEVRELGRLMTGLTGLVRKLYEHVHGQASKEKEEVRLLTPCQTCGKHHIVEIGECPLEVAGPLPEVSDAG